MYFFFQNHVFKWITNCQPRAYCFTCRGSYSPRKWKGERFGNFAFRQKINTSRHLPHDLPTFFGQTFCQGPSYSSNLFTGMNTISLKDTTKAPFMVLKHRCQVMAYNLSAHRFPVDKMAECSTGKKDCFAYQCLWQERRHHF